MNTHIKIPRTHARVAVKLALAVAVLVMCVCAAESSASIPAGVHAASAHFPCSAANSATVPCHFSTPSGNVRCLWTPKPNSVACVLRSTRRAYRLRPTGRAKAIRLTLARRGQTLPRGDQIVFPDSLSCRDTNVTMTCNQDFGDGEFVLARGRSHSS